MGARLQHETKLSCVWEESRIKTRVSVLNAAGCYREVTKSNLCRRAPMCPPANRGCFPMKENISIIVSISINITKIIVWPGCEHKDMPTHNAFLLFAFCPSALSPQRAKWGSFRNSFARKWRRCRSSRRTEDIWWSSVRSVQPHINVHCRYWAGKTPQLGAKVLIIFVQNKKNHCFISQLLWKPIGPCFRLVLLF